MSQERFVKGFRRIVILARREMRKRPWICSLNAIWACRYTLIITSIGVLCMLLPEQTRDSIRVLAERATEDNKRQTVIPVLISGVALCLFGWSVWILLRMTLRTLPMNQPATKLKRIIPSTLPTFAAITLMTSAFIATAKASLLDRDVISMKLETLEVLIS